MTSLINSTLCSSLNFITNTISILVNPALFNSSYTSLKVLLFSLIFAFLYKLSYAPIFKSFIIKIKALPNNQNESELLSILILLSFNPGSLLNSNLTLLAFGIQLIVLSFSIYTIYKEIVLNDMYLKFDTLIMQNYSIQSLVDKVRTFKHDYNNTLCSIGGYISLNDMNGLKNFFTRLNLDMNATNTMQLINTTNINEPSIYNLLSLKHKIIMQNNIKFDFYSSINYKALSIPAYELSKILGILLDNAIDAALLSDEKEISLTCRSYKNNIYQITLRNSYINKDVNIRDIYKKGFSSKKVKSGLGLWEVSKLVEEFPNISLSTQKTNEYFTQNLQIPIKDVF